MLHKKNERLMYCLKYGNESKEVRKMKSKIAAGVLAILLGQLGIHNFYLGYTKRGIIQLLATIFFSWTYFIPLVIWAWAIYEAVQILTGKVVDAKGQPLQ